jgi:hypothetical protein
VSREARFEAVRKLMNELEKILETFENQELMLKFHTLAVEIYKRI